MKKNSEVLKGVKVGDVITADWLNKVAAAINKNSSAIKAPTQKDIDLGSSGGGDSIGDETFSASSGNITTSTVTITDSSGNTHDIDRITQIVFTEDATGRSMTLNITY